MTATNNPGHPELESLLAFAEGELAADQAAPVAVHLEGCALCRLEIKRFAQFEAGGEDPEAAQDAQWDRAELQLARAWKEEIQPSISAAPARRPRLLWLVPAAAAAVAAFFFLQPAAPPEPGPLGGPGSTVVRGAGEIAAPEIILQDPMGELEALPEQFTWQTDRKCTSYTLEIFTADLQLVYFQTEIEKPFWDITKELKKLLEPDTVYLWSVQGYLDLKAVAESGNGWFKVAP